MGDLTEHFSRREFRCPHGPADDSALWRNIEALARNLETIRAATGAAVHVISGYRCPACNRACGGARNSQHLQGRAADIWSPMWTVKDLHELILALIREGRIIDGGVGLYFRGRETQRRPFVHYDIRGTRARWRQQRR